MLIQDRLEKWQNEGNNGDTGRQLLNLLPKISEGQQFSTRIKICLQLNASPFKDIHI